MKFIHLSDPHIIPRSQQLLGVDVSLRLNAAVDSICKNYPDAELCIVTGDLVDRGDEESYRDVCRILDRLPMLWHGLMGNHDKGGVARATLSHLPWQDDGSLQYEIATDVGQFIILDSSIDAHSGRLSESRLKWLQRQLEATKASGKDAYIFMHHVPFDIDIPWLDQIKLENGDELWATFREFDNIRHMFFGHVHRPVHGSWHGIPFSTVRATAHQVALRFGMQKGFVDEAPAFAVVIIDGERVVIHDHSFMDDHLPVVK